ncbi:MAG: agmatine deiminase family protein [Saprospiraceae bacterium]|nr:agmatine deiminase family protein [Saprospiraceae bacterium]
MYKYYVIIFLGIYTSIALGQDLPRGFSGNEAGRMQEYLARTIKSLPNRGEIVPGRMRSMAEWEELQGLIISWVNSYRDIQAEIVRAVIPQCRIIITCSNPDNVKSFLESKGIADNGNIQYVVGKYNSIWVRDYGPNSVYLNDVDSLYLTDWIYNRPRYQDDTLARQLSRSLHLPLLETNTVPDDLVHTGGNYMSDGLGLAFSSLLVMDENGPLNHYGFSNHTEAEVDSIMKKYMGTQTYIKMETLPYDAIHHIDMHMKILDEQTILVGRYQNNVADGAQINANIDYVLSNFKNSFGKPFRIVYIPMPPGPNGEYPDNNGDYRTYTNSVFVNKTVIVPFYQEKYDTAAENIYRQTLPGYNIVGIDCNKIIPSLGAIHCITKEVGVTDPLMISVNQAEPFVDASDEGARKIGARVKNRSGIREVRLYYRQDKDDTGWSQIRMEQDSAYEDYFTAVLPPFDSLSEYYVEAEANSGKILSRPMTAPDGYFSTRTLSTNFTAKVTLPVNLEIYPNPAKATTAIHLSLFSRQKISVKLFDSNGKEVLTIFDGQWNPSQPKLFFNARNLTPGLYFVRIHGRGIEAAAKVVVVH